MTGTETGTRTGTTRTTGTTATRTTGTATTVTTATATASRQNARMPRLRASRRFGPVGTALTLWEIWRRLPPRQRKWVAQQVRMHGPRIAKQAIQAQRNRAGRRPRG